MEEQGAEGHGWLNTTYPLMMMYGQVVMNAKEDLANYQRVRAHSVPWFYTAHYQQSKLN